MELFFGIVFVPFGEVEFLATLVNIVGNKQGTGGEATIPRPHGFVGMAVPAFFFENRHHFGGDFYFLSHRWIIAFDRDELDPYQDGK